MNITDYSIPRPAYPILLRLLAGLVITGLVGLGIVAFETFRLVHGPVVALIFAIVIEVGAAIDSIGLARGINKRTWWLVPAILITLVVSGWYNLATVAKNAAALGIAGEATLAWVEHAIAWGPLASLAFMALGVGFQIADHERSVSAWQVNRQIWLDNQQVAQITTQKEQQEMELHDREQARALSARLELEKEKARLAAETEQERIRVAGETKAEVSRARIEAKERSRQNSEDPSKLSGNFPPLNWRRLPAEDKEIIGTLSTTEIVQRYNISDRTARNWKANASVSNNNGRNHE